MASLILVEMGWTHTAVRKGANGVRYEANRERLADYPSALFDRLDPRTKNQAVTHPLAMKMSALGAAATNVEQAYR